MVKAAAVALLLLTSNLFAGTTSPRLGLDRLDVLGDDYFILFPGVIDDLDVLSFDIRAGATNAVYAKTDFFGVVNFASATLSGLNLASLDLSNISSATVSGMLYAASASGRVCVGTTTVSSLCNESVGQKMVIVTSLSGDGLKIVAPFAPSIILQSQSPPIMSTMTINSSGQFVITDPLSGTFIIQSSTASLASLSTAISTNAAAFNLYASTTAANEAAFRASVLSSTTSLKAQADANSVNISTNSDAFTLWKSTHDVDEASNRVSVSASTNTLQLTASNTNYFNLSGSTQAKSGGATYGGAVTASVFNGSGSGLTNLPAGMSASSEASHTTDISEIFFVGVTTLNVTLAGLRFVSISLCIDLLNSSAATRTYSARLLRNGTPIGLIWDYPLINTDQKVACFKWTENSSTAGANVFLAEIRSTAGAATQSAMERILVVEER